MQYFGLLDDSRWQGWKHDGRKEREKERCMRGYNNAERLLDGKLAALWFCKKS